MSFIFLIKLRTDALNRRHSLFVMQVKIIGFNKKFYADDIYLLQQDMGRNVLKGPNDQFLYIDGKFYLIG